MVRANMERNVVLTIQSKSLMFNSTCQQGGMILTYNLRRTQKKSAEYTTINDISSGSEILPPNILRMLLPPQNELPCTEEKEMKVQKVHPYIL